MAGFFAESFLLQPAEQPTAAEMASLEQTAINFMLFGLRYAIIRKPLVCWMAARGNLEVLSNSAELDEAEESPLNGAARPKLVPIPILSHPRSNSSGLLILNTDEAVSYLSLR